MRIALVITELEPGGAEQCLVNLACFLKNEGHEIRVLAVGPPPGRRQLVEQLESNGIPCSFGNAQTTWKFLQACHWLQHELQQFAPDIVQSMLFHANVLAAWASRRLPCRVFGGVRVRQPQRWRWWLQRQAAKRMEKLVCVSRGVQAHCQRAERINPAKLVVIPNGIPLIDLPGSCQTADWSRFGMPKAARVLLFVGRLDPQKGVEPLLRHADSILEPLPDHHLVLMGDGPLAQVLSQAHQQLRHASRVHLVGWQPQPLDWMRLSQLLLLPTKYEGMPNVLLEAMSLAKPVVAFDVDGVRDLLGHDQLAVHQVIPADDFPAFVAAIHALAVQPGFARSCGAHNRRRIETEFELGRQMAKYLDLYQAN